MNKENIGLCELYLGDCFEILDQMKDETIEACLTDPPYLKANIPFYEMLARRLKRLLVIGGSFVAITPHYALPEILSEVGKHLKYRWMINMNQMDGQHPRMAMGIEVTWKPITWWVNQKWPHGRGFVKDGFINEPVEKKLHKWQQSLSWSDYCVKKFIYSLAPVLDPFMGSGTMAISCIRRGQPFIGIENDKKSFDLACERIKEEYEREAW